AADNHGLARAEIKMRSLPRGQRRGVYYRFTGDISGPERESCHMKRLSVLLLLACAAVLVTTDSSAAHFRRRCRPCPPCPCPWIVVRPLCAERAPLTVRSTPTEYFTSPKGKVYRITFSYEPPFRFERPAAFPSVRAARGRDDFIGHDRMAAKTSIAAAATEPFAALQDLLDELMQRFPDDQMRNRNPPIRKDPDSDRVAEENRNITLTAWLYAVKKEANDNDYHLIIGTDPDVAPIQYMNMEISGLPPSEPTRTKLRVPRQALKDFLREHHESVGTSGYLRFEDPVPVRVTGSLFYDIDHAPGEVGSFKPPSRVPATAWEIHPITAIVFEP